MHEILLGIRKKCTCLQTGSIGIGNESGSGKSVFKAGALKEMETPENLLLQLEYSNKHLKERYSSLQREVENVEGDNGALLKDISNLRRETKRRMEAESKRRILLEEMAEVRENLASENLVALNLKESVKELENQNEELKLEASHLSEENSALSTSHSNREQRLRKMRSSLRKLEIELQNYRLSSIEQNEELRKVSAICHNSTQ
ncbi:uncharacterized protein LOC142465457 [Ascaphus truei]|uniref:uncharacterized protein LOC142465457 n=1 Tax=Ascaphus truei TaxID=8439 RepID=UPI003F5A42D7